MRLLPACLLLLPLLACRRGDDSSADAPSVIRSMSIDDKTTSVIEFESAHAKGRIEIQAGVPIGYRSTTVTTSGPQAASSVRSRLTIRDQLLSFDGPELRLGDRSYGTLSGEVQVRIAPEGVFVNGEKRGGL